MLGTDKVVTTLDTRATITKTTRLVQTITIRIVGLEVIIIASLSNKTDITKKATITMARKMGLREVIRKSTRLLKNNTRLVK
jgi:hypothetical protein